MRTPFFIVIFILFFSSVTYSQTDTVFWFAVPYMTLTHDGPTTADLTLSATDKVYKTTVIIDQPYNPQIPNDTIIIDPAFSLTENRNYTEAEMLKFSNNFYNTKSNSAIRIRADREITAYYEIHREKNNPAIFALKGQNALGKDFWTPFQTHWNNHDWDNPLTDTDGDLSDKGDPAFSQIVVVATEDQTDIWVTFKYPAYGYAAGTTHHIYLEKAGMTYTFVPKENAGDNNEPSTLATDRLRGTHITSNKPIAVTLGDDSVQKSGAYDYLGDQHIPTINKYNKTVIGLEYIVMKGQVSNNNSGERVYILTTQPSTTITVTHKTGTVTTSTITTAGTQVDFQMLESVPVGTGDYWTHILADKPIYILHIAGFGDELGEAILPTVDGCTGSLSVSFTRSKTDPFYMNIMTKADAIDSFYISIDGGPSTRFLNNPALWEQAATSDWYVLKNANKLMNESVIHTGQVTQIYNTKNVFHLGYFNGVTSGGGCVYGYFSDYNELEASANVENQGSVFQACGVDSIQLKAKGGISYHWSPTEYLNNPNTQNPILYPPYGGFIQDFTVAIEQPCHGWDTLHVWVIVPKSPNAFIAVSKDNGCGPLTINLKDQSSGANQYILDLGDGSPISVSPNPFNLTYTYPNNTDTIKEYSIDYTVRSPDGCTHYYNDTITVYPEINSSFVMTDPGDTAVCNLTTIGFRSTSTGDTATYQWDYGDGSSDNDTLVQHVYTNYGHNDTSYYVKLVSVSPYGCQDTSDRTKIRVFPYIYSSFTVDSTLQCSPAKLYIDPTVSAGVDTFYWSIYDINKSFLNNSFKKLNESPFDFLHSNTTHPVPDSIEVSMWAANRFGCYDSATTRSIIVYPQVDAEFTIDDNAVCDSVGVLFTNNSKGFNLTYEWDFNNGTNLSTINNNPFTRYFLNRSSNDTIYNIRLTTKSNYICTDTFSLPLTVYPFVNANFAIDFSSNCSPLVANLTNTSIGGDVFDWRFGDGSTYSTFIPESINHTYNNNTDKDTTYNIKLITRNSQGCVDSIGRSVFLFAQVVAGFDFGSPNEGCNPLEVSFINQSKGNNLEYQWDFGDKTFSTSQNPPPNIYKNSTAKDSSYTIELTVMNLAGCDSIIEKNVTVYSKVTADFSIERLDSCSPFKIKVDNFSSGGITEFIWKYKEDAFITLSDFTDPDIPPYINLSDKLARYPFELTTKNSHGCTAVKSDSITVFPEMHAMFTSDITMGCQPLPVNFTNNSNIKAGTSFNWDFDDGKFSNLVDPPEHIYSNLTNANVDHLVNLKATTQYGCYDDTTINIRVFPYIYAKFNLDRAEICSDELFSIDRTASTGFSQFLWDYENDGTNDEDKTEDVFDHTYGNYGSDDLLKTIRLTVTNSEGCDTSWTESITIHPQVRAKFDIDDSEICYPATTRFTNFSEPAVDPSYLTYSWDFGDGSGSSNKDPEHNYKNFSRISDGSFEIFLTSTSKFGCDSTVSKTLTVHPKPLADFNFPVAADCPPFPVHFTDNSMGVNLTYKWDFGNGMTCSDQNASTVYNNNGTSINENTVSLIINTAFNCSDTATKPVYVYPDVEVDYSASDWSGCSPMQINLNGSATNENEYYWYIDGEVVSNYEDPSYRFSNESSDDKVFNVTFRANSINGCTDDTTKVITVYPNPRAEFLPDPQAQDFNTETDITEVTFNNQTNNQSAWNYQWNFGDGSKGSQDDASFIKKYTIWGDIHNMNRIPVVLIATNVNHPQCTDTMLHYVIIKPPLPQVELGADVAGCMPLIVDFPSTTKYVYNDSYQWDFGIDDEYSGEKKPGSMVYNKAGTYIVRLSVEGDGGTNWDYKTVRVYAKPVVNFSFTPDSAWVKSQTESGTPIMFINLTDKAINYTWNFGDMSTLSNEFEPEHEYTEEGTYYVTLMAENAEGCTDTLTHIPPVVIMAHGRLDFPSVITITSDNPADEYYDATDFENTAIFRPVNIGVDKFKLEIYNRWGELIFESNDVNKGWNGFIDGSPVKQDVYVWRARATFTNGRTFVGAGDVTVLVKEP